MSGTDDLDRKARFDHAYNAPDPRAYFAALRALSYEVPAHAEPVFRRLLEAQAAARPLVVDVACSYGVNAALLNHEVTLGELYERYTDELADTSDTAAVAARDERFYAARRRQDAVAVVGLDIADRAVAYAVRVGLLAAGFSDDLEAAAPSAELAGAVRDATFVTVTGGIGYIGAATFERLLHPMQRSPWVAAFVLRVVDAEPTLAALRRHGLVVDRLEGATFPQRRFASDEERAFALERLADRGIDPTGKEAGGWYHTDLYVATPPGARPDIRALLDPLLG